MFFIEDAAEEQEHGNDVGGFPGGPSDTSMLTTFVDHVACVIRGIQLSKVCL